MIALANGVGSNYIFAWKSLLFLACAHEPTHNSCVLLMHTCTNSHECMSTLTCICTGMCPMCNRVPVVVVCVCRGQELIQTITGQVCDGCTCPSTPKHNEFWKKFLRTIVNWWSCNSFNRLVNLAVSWDIGLFDSICKKNWFIIYKRQRSACIQLPVFTFVDVV